MNRIFLVLSILGNLALGATFALGWRIEDAGSLAASARQQVQWHFQFALGSILFVLMMHGIVLTYFMGTGRWIEETCEAYSFTGTARAENLRMKYRVIPGMVACLALLITTGAFGAIADPASNMKMPSAATIHFCLACATLLLNFIVSGLEYQQIVRNGAVVQQVYQEVRRVRRERGLDAPELRVES